MSVNRVNTSTRILRDANGSEFVPNTAAGNSTISKHTLQLTQWFKRTASLQGFVVANLE